MAKYMVRVQRDDEDARATVTETAEALIADYGHSLLVSLDEDAVEQLKARNFPCRPQPTPDEVDIGAYTLKVAPSEAAEPGLLSLAVSGIEPSRPELVLLRLAGPLHPDWKRDLEEMGTMIYQREDAHHYLARAASDHIEALESRDYIESVQPYHPMLKVDQALLAAGAAEVTETPSFMTLRAEPLAMADERDDELARTVSATPPTAPPDHGANLELTLFDPEQLEPVVTRLEAMGADVVHAEGNAVLVRAEIGQVSELASLVEIQQINPFYPPELFNNVASEIINTDRLRNTLGLDGSGQVVAVADSGLDTGDSQTVLDDFAGRVLSLQALGRPGDASDPNGHGTHVAGSVLGDGSLSNGLVQGIAPGAALVFQSLMDTAGGLSGLNTGLSNLLTQALQEGASLHNNSWGSRKSNGGYLAHAASADRFAFEHRNFLILFAAGNDGPTFRVSSPGSAKNVLTVGASESLRALPASVNFPASPSFPNGAAISGLDLQADDPSDVADFSCPGPVAQNRRKPDVVAPGSWILSCRSSEARADTGPDGLPLTGDEDSVPTHAEAVARGLPGRPVFGKGSANTPPLPTGAGQDAEEHYMYDSGTSMACPITTGACALVRQFLMEQRQHDPSAALLKALIVNGATDMGLGVPHRDQGWGRIDLENTLFPVEGEGLHFDDSLDNALETTEAHGWEIVPLDLNTPVSVTLVWRDPQGETIQNPLHLVVRHDPSNDEFMADNASSVRNNVQKVIVEPREAEERWVIEVEAGDVTQGVPELQPETRQDFALVVSNAQTLVQIF